MPPAKQLRDLFTTILLVFIIAAAANLPVIVLSGAGDVRRSDFPDTFVFGAGSSAYQVEGAAFEDGRMPSIWDTFAHAGIYGGANADVSCDAYHKYKSTQHGFVGLNLFAYRPIPCTNETADINAVQRVYDFYVGWFANPLIFGDYPDVMKRNVGSRLPEFTREESMQVKGAIDFIALNHYQTIHVKDSSSSLESKIRDYTIDGAFELIYTEEDSPPDQVSLANIHESMMTLPCLYNFYLIFHLTICSV
uniref:Beta-glucosidase n=1 Tax=Solanum tuberosum TaxID=4113 RepID=M1AT78_SOLTU